MLVSRSKSDLSTTIKEISALGRMLNHGWHIPMHALLYISKFLCSKNFVNYSWVMKILFSKWLVEEEISLVLTIHEIENCFQGKTA